MTGASRLSGPARLRLFRGLAIAATVVAYGQIALGGVVRVSGSGLGCGNDWPLCHGSLLPPLDLPTWIEWGHRLTAATVSWLILGTAVVGWGLLRARKDLVGWSTVALLLIPLLAGLGAVVVKLDLPPEVIVAHLALALALLATLVVAATLSFLPAGVRARSNGLARLAFVATCGTYLLLLSGAAVTGGGAAAACPDWPLCGGSGAPFQQTVHILHRLAAGTFGVLILATLAAVWRTRRPAGVLLVAATVTGVLFVLQVGVGAGNIFLRWPAPLLGAHVALAAAVWAGMVVVTVLAYRLESPPRAAPELGERPRRGTREVALDYLALTKPRIMVLLLLATLGGMGIAAGGMPPPRLLLWTMLGGYLAAGGASALNQVIDRDIDGLMLRTRHRPVASGRLPARHALVFGLALGAASLVVFAVFVNGLAAALAFAGFFFYVVVYSLWLKRATPQNIVIGGAAGAFPPLVGWAAVTGRLDLPALVLFAVIFFWTPPHFWALALLKRGDYERAGVPMLPVVAGEAATRRQIFLYTLLLVGVTLLPVLVRDLGAIYLVTAVALGGAFVVQAWVLLRRAEAHLARRLFTYSNAYLALLLLGMVIDHSVLG